MPRYALGVIWEPFILALFLGLVVSAGLYFAYLWPAVEPDDEALDAEDAAREAEAAEHEEAAAKAAAGGVMSSEPADEEPEVPAAEEAKLAEEAKAGSEATS
jgi:hypothetical protein